MTFVCVWQSGDNLESVLLSPYYGVPVINLHRQAWQQSTFPSLAISPTPPCILLVSIYSYMIIFDNSEMIVYLWYSVLSVGNTKADKMGQEAKA